MIHSPFLGGLQAVRESKVSFTVKAIMSNPTNEFPWRSLRVFYKGDHKLLVRDYQVPSLKTNPDCVFALILLLDLLCYGFKRSGEYTSVIESVRHSARDTSNVKFAKTICSVLERVDRKTIGLVCNSKNWGPIMDLENFETFISSLSGQVT